MRFIAGRCVDRKDYEQVASSMSTIGKKLAGKSTQVLAFDALFELVFFGF